MLCIIESGYSLFKIQIVKIGKIHFQMLSDLNSYLERNIQLSAIKRGQY